MGLFVGIIVGIIVGMSFEHKRCETIIIDKIKKCDKFINMFQLCIQWIKLYEKNIKIDAYLKWEGYNKVAIYGNGEIGQCLLNGLRHSDINVEYIIDRRSTEIVSHIPVFSIDDELPEVDVIVVTVLNDYNIIKNELKKKGNYNVVSVNDVIFGSTVS